LPMALLYFDLLLLSYTVDMPEALRMLAHAVREACAPDDVDMATRKRMAYTKTAELLLLQHTCHWFCKSPTIASMRLMARQKTSYEQVLKNVEPSTLKSYQHLLAAQSK